MIVEDKENYFQVFKVTGKKYLLFLFMVLTITQIVKFFHLEQSLIQTGLTGLVSSAISIFLGFRMSAAYSRWRDGHDMFRSLITTASSVMTQISILATSTYADLDHFKWNTATILMQYVQLVKLELTTDLDADCSGALKALTFNESPLFSEQTIHDLNNKKIKGNYALKRLGELTHLYQLTSKDNSSFIISREIMKEINRLRVLAEKMNSLKSTPFPWGYQFYTRLFVRILPVLIMCSELNQLHMTDQLMIAFIATVFTTTEQIARNLDDPITSPFNGIPFEALCRTLEIQLLEDLDIQHNLNFIVANHGILH